MVKLKKINFLKIAFVLTAVFSTSSCANFFIRQECEKYNWYQVGYDAALRGERISNDDKVSRCRKAEAEISESQLDVGFKAGMARYCQPDTAYQTGKQGDTLNMDFCEPNVLGLLRKRHQEGNTAYCKDGLTAGQSGKRYKNVCSAELEKSFMPDYKKGRKKYLDGMVQAKQIRQREINVDMDRLYFEKRLAESRLSVIPQAVSGQKDPYFSERSDLNMRLSSVNSRLSQTQSEKSQIDKEIMDYRAELATLD